MRCFLHPQAEAVGLCKVCAKGLCPQCAADLGHSLACRHSHEARAQAVHAMLDQSLNLQQVAGKGRYVAPALFVFTGAVFVYAARHVGLGWISAIGLAFMAFGVALGLLNQRAFRKRKPD